MAASFTHRVSVSKDWVWLMDTKSYAAVQHVEAFGEQFSLECVRQGVLDLWHLEPQLKWALGEQC